jgi:hypothetical protein
MKFRKESGFALSRFVPVRRKKCNDFKGLGAASHLPISSSSRVEIFHAARRR